MVWDLPCMQQASYLEGTHWCGCFSCSLHVNKKSDDDDDDYDDSVVSYRFALRVNTGL